MQPVEQTHLCCSEQVHVQVHVLTRDISEKIRKKRALSVLTVSVQVIRLQGAGREKMLSYITYTNPKPATVQGMPHLRD